MTATPRASRRGAREVIPPALLPWLAVVLGVDTARNSGWSIYVCGKLVTSGELDAFDARAVREVIALALEHARAANLPCCMMLEAPYGGSVATVSGIGAAIGSWVAAWCELAAADGHRQKISRVTASTWRRLVLGPEYGNATRESCRDAELLVAARLLGVHAVEMGADRAAGLCIGYYGTRAGEIGKLIGPRARAASVDAWTRRRSA